VIGGVPTIDSQLLL